jgi:medium-chain acyl-[acyl-carrier-protein] hydrolase
VGPSAYRPWAAELPSEVELCIAQLPGREARLGDPPVEDFAELVESLAEQIQPLLDRPFAFFGHSMGALVGFELARSLVHAGYAEPVGFFASGRRAPRIPDDEPPMGHLDDEAFVAEIQRRYGGIPEQVLEHRELLELLIPGLRADIAALEGYRYRPGEPLECPLFAFGGTQDERVTLPRLEAWREETRGAFSLRLFPGGHFFPQSARAQVLDGIVTALRRAVAPQLERTGT